jgi:GT2 family glycosyltransferase
MNLQNVIFPSEGTSNENRLYFRVFGKSYYNTIKGCLVVNQDAKVSFDTYFNSFSIGKWLKYTKVEKVGLRLRIKGEFLVSLTYKVEKVTNQITGQVVQTLPYDTKGKVKEITIPLNMDYQEGMYAFECLALGEGCEIYGGEYYTETQQTEDVKIAISICTYRREQYIKNNTDILKEAFFENENSELKDKLIVYISDNGNTLDINTYNTKHIQVLPNKNAGGAGGFTRGLIEAMKDKEETKVTHVLLMDDDVIIQPESIYRTYAIWALIKEEYRDSFIGGSVLNSDQPWKQIESGACWYTGKVASKKAGLDLRGIKACLRNEMEEHTEYQGWWYCSFSLEHARNDNLPLPLFIKVDDIEYSLRNMKHLILLNGICVWHEPFEYKNLSSFYYYWYRNWLINNGVRGNIHPYAKKIFWNELQGRVIQESFTMRYKNAKLLLRAVEDFLKGISWFKEQDPEILNRNIIENGYALAPLDGLEVPFNLLQYVETKNLIEGRFHRNFRRLILNGIFLKSTDDAIIPIVNPSIFFVYRKERALNYDYSSKKGYVTKKDNRELIQIIRNLYRVKRKYNRMYEEVSKEYNSRGKELMKLSFWEKYLGI